MQKKGFIAVSAGSTSRRFFEENIYGLAKSDELTAFENDEKYEQMTLSECFNRKDDTNE